MHSASRFIGMRIRVRSESSGPSTSSENRVSWRRPVGPHARASHYLHLQSLYLHDQRHDGAPAQAPIQRHRASHLHYITFMKTATLPAVRVEPRLRSDAEAVLDEGESLSDFVAACVRDGVAWRRTQDAFLARAADSVERSERERTGITPKQMLQRMDDRLESARRQLPGRKTGAAR